jgi:subtilisin family serine protease
MSNQFTEYVVVCKPDANCDSLWNDIEQTVSLSTVPDRPVQIADNRDDWSNMCNYWLTPNEVELLKTDPRVEDVSIPSKNLPNFLGLHTIQSGNFDKPQNITNSSGLYINWGLIRHSFDYNVYGTQISTNQNYQYSVDGNGVDVVIWDSGIEVNHPEFLDDNNQTRVQTIDWYQEAGEVGTMPALFYTDINGHGTACAGIVAGKTFGFAKKSKIYAMNTVPFVAGRSINLETAARLIRKWHENKPVDPTTGFKRPTVVNASFGQSISMTDYTLVGGNYQGTPWTSNDWGIHWASKGVNPTYQRVPYWSAEDNGFLQLMQDAGIIICHSAGNEGYKASEISVDPNDDSNNSITIQFTPNFSWYYMRGSSPFASKTITVGALDTFAKNATQDKKVGYSNAGSLVKVFGASGGDAQNLWSIMTSTSTVNTYGSFAQNYRDGAGPYKQVFFSGTSAACPEIAGIAAIYMQVNPSATPTQVYDWFTNTASKTSLYSTGLSDDYNTVDSQWGGAGGVAFMPYNSANNFAVSNGITLSNITLVNT